MVVFELDGVHEEIMTPADEYSFALIEFKRAYVFAIHQAVTCLNMAFSGAYDEEGLAQLMSQAYVALEVDEEDATPGVSDQVHDVVKLHIMEALRPENKPNTVNLLSPDGSNADMLRKWVTQVLNLDDVGERVTQQGGGEPTAAAASSSSAMEAPHVIPMEE